MRHGDHVRGCEWSAVPNSAADYGMRRMSSILSEQAGVTIQVFQRYGETRRRLLGA